MKKLKITLEDAKATLRDAATGPDSQNWRYSPAVKALLNSHDELLVALGEMKHRAEAAEQQNAPTLWLWEHIGSAPYLTSISPESDPEASKLLSEGWTVRGLCDAIHELFTAPPALPDDYFGLLVRKARASADKAIRKYPQPNYVLNKVAEESGEVIKAVIHYTEGREEWVNVEGEIIDNLAMLIRLVTEGDQVIGFTPPEACHTACEPHKLTGIAQSDHLKRALKLAGEAKELADRIRAEELTLQAPVVPDFGALAKLLVEHLVDCGAADDDVIAQYEEFAHKACRAAMLPSARKAD